LCAGDGKPRVLVHTVNDRGSIETLNEEGQLQLILNSSERGGAVSALDNDHNLVITMGHEAHGAGLFVVNLRENLTFAAPLVPQAPPFPARIRPPGPVPAAPPNPEKPTTEGGDKDKSDPASKPPEPVSPAPPKNP